MNKIMLMIAIIGLFLVSGCQENKDNGPVPEEQFKCNSDDDCIPLPSACHPIQCINKEYESNYKKPEICTLIFVLKAAYTPEDCVCIENKCVNKNLGKNYESDEIPIEEARKIAESECRQSGGVWRTFPNSCCDYCFSKKNEGEVSCPRRFTDSCDCGEDKCWNGKTCELFISNKTIITNKIVNLKKVCINATIRAIEFKIEQYQKRIEAMEGGEEQYKIESYKEEIEKLEDYKNNLKEYVKQYENARLKYFLLPEKREVIGWVDKPFKENMRLEVEGMTRGGPFYYVTGIKGNDYDVIKPEVKYQMTIYLVYQGPYGGYYDHSVYIDNWEKVE